jgi:hypothetical protein
MRDRSVAADGRPRTRDPYVRAEAAAQLAVLVRAGAPLRRALAAISGRLVATRAWERLGFARARDYAVERAGVSPRQLQELAHVDVALAGLPRIEVALAAGRVSWTKARLLCRVATREDEALWLEAAGRLSARALAREVRAVDRRSLEGGGAAVEEADARPRETVFLHCSASVRARWYSGRQLAQRIAGAPLPPWAYAENVAAEVLSAVGLEVEPEAGPEPERSEVSASGRPAGEAPGGAGRGEGAPDSAATSSRSFDAVDSAAPWPRGLHAVASAVESPRSPHALDSAAPSPPGFDATHSDADTPRSCHAAPSPSPATAAFLESLVAGLESADAFALDARLRRALRLEQRHWAEIGPWLLAVASERLFRALGYRGLDDYASQELGMAPSKARALLRLERLALMSPAFREAWREGHLSWTQANALAPLLGLEASRRWHAAWIERARHVTLRRLEEDVDHALATGELDPAALPPLPAGLQTGAPPTGSEAKVRLFFTAPRDVARLFRAVLATVQRRIERARGRPSSEGEALDAMLEHVFEAWGRGRPVPRKYRVFARDGWRCTVAGCTAYRNLHDHHIEYRSAGGSDDLANRTTLCVWHHLRGVHAGVIECAGRAPGGLHFALGLRPGRPPLAVYASGDFLVSEGTVMAA